MATRMVGGFILVAFLIVHPAPVPDLGALTI